MGSKSPKWLIKQKRKRVVAARRAARAANPGCRNLGVRRLGRHGGPYKEAHPSKG